MNCTNSHPVQRSYLHSIDSIYSARSTLVVQKQTCPSMTVLTLGLIKYVISSTYETMPTNLLVANMCVRHCDCIF